MRIERVPIYILLMFTAVYMAFGNPDNPIWSGLYFISNYVLMFLLFADHKDKDVRLIGEALSLAILLFIVSKFFLSLDVEKLRYLNALTFFIIALSLYKLEPK